MNVKVVIPWRHIESRVPGFNWIKAYYSHRFGEENVWIEHDDSTSPFNRSKIINRGVSRFPESVVIISDADCFVCDHAIKRAVNEAAGKHAGRLIIPHSSYCKTRKREKNKILSRDPSDKVRGNWFMHLRGHKANGGIWVVNASLFLSHRMDERFIGWGSEDTEFIRRIPNTRYKGPIYHIWHPKASRNHYPRNRALLRKIARGEA